MPRKGSKVAKQTKPTLRTRVVSEVPIEDPFPRHPYHQSVLLALKDALRQKNPIVRGELLMAFAEHVNRTSVPPEEVMRLARALRRLSKRTHLPEPLIDAAVRLELLHERNIR